MKRTDQHDQHDDDMHVDTDEVIAWFDGIIEGRRSGDDQRLQRLVRAVNAAGLVHFDLDRDGGEFSLLADDTPLASDRFTPERQEAFRAALERLMAWAVGNGPVESTLRCTEVRLRESRESLFAVDADGLQVITRARPVTEEERILLAQSSAARPTVDWRPDMRMAALIAGMVLILSVLVSWQSGLFHRAFAAEAASLQIDTGPFGDLLEVELGADWGRYEISLGRGTAYPDSVATVQERLAGASSMVERAAINAVADGEVIYCRLLDAEGAVLAVTAASLRSLVSRETGTATVHLLGHMRAHSVDLSLDAGQDDSEQ